MVTPHDSTADASGESKPENGADSAEERQDADPAGSPADKAAARPTEVGGRKGPDPTRYGDWEKAGRCIDF